VRSPCEAIVSEQCNADAIHKHLRQISKATKPGHFAIVVMDQAPWHKSQNDEDLRNVAPIFLPPYSPELNPMEQVWKWIKDHFLSNRIFENYEDIEESSCNAWNGFVSQPDLFQTICNPSWAQLIP
jgi:transposase